MDLHFGMEVKIWGGRIQIDSGTMSKSRSQLWILKKLGRIQGASQVKARVWLAHMHRIHSYEMGIITA